MRDSIVHGQTMTEFSRTLLPEMTALFPQVMSVTTGQSLRTYWDDTVMRDTNIFMVNVTVSKEITPVEETRISGWLQMRLGRNDIQLLVSPDATEQPTPSKTKSARR